MAGQCVVPCPPVAVLVVVVVVGSVVAGLVPAPAVGELLVGGGGADLGVHAGVVVEEEVEKLFRKLLLLNLLPIQ